MTSFERDMAALDKSALMQADRAWAKAAAEVNLDGLMAFYHNSASLLPQSASPVEGKEKVRDFFKG
jgi:ketosteroid isomerase-like protein